MIRTNGYITIDGKAINKWTPQLYILGTNADAAPGAKRDQCKMANKNGIGRFWKTESHIKKANSNITIAMKIRVPEQCVIPVLIYGVETWLFTEKNIHKMQIKRWYSAQSLSKVIIIPSPRSPRTRFGFVVYSIQSDPPLAPAGSEEVNLVFLQKSAYVLSSTSVVGRHWVSSIRPAVSALILSSTWWSSCF